MKRRNISQALVIAVAALSISAESQASPMRACSTQFTEQAEVDGIQSQQQMADILTNQGQREVCDVQR